LAGIREKITVATEAALWALSNGRCYAPGCSFPVVIEIRPGVYRKNAQIAHIHGVRAPRYAPGLSAEQCAAFSNLLLLCLPHHSEVDDRKTGERLYPPEVLIKWKTDHEGSNGPALAALGPIDEDSLTELLLDVFTPPLERLQQITDQLEETGTLNAQTVVELRQVIEVMSTTPMGLDAQTAVMMMDAAEVYGNSKFYQAAMALADTAEIMPQLYEIAELMSNASRRMGRYDEEQ
jgi:hypothetical protein